MPDEANRGKERNEACEVERRRRGRRGRRKSGIRIEISYKPNGNIK